MDEQQRTGVSTVSDTFMFDAVVLVNKMIRDHEHRGYDAVSVTYAGYHREKHTFVLVFRRIPSGHEVSTDV